MEKEMRAEHLVALAARLEAAGMEADPARVPALWVGAAAVSFPCRQCRGILMLRPHPRDQCNVRCGDVGRDQAGGGDGDL